MNQSDLKVWSFYVHKGTAYISVTGKTTAGFFMNVEPVHVVPASDVEALKQALNDVMKQGNPTVPTLMRHEYPKPFVLKYAKVKSLSAFEKDAQAWDITAKDGVYKIQQMRRRADNRGFEDDPSRTETLPPGTTLDDVAERAASLVHAANKEASAA